MTIRLHKYNHKYKQEFVWIIRKGAKQRIIRGEKTRLHKKIGLLKRQHFIFPSCYGLKTTILLPAMGAKKPLCFSAGFDLTPFLSSSGLFQAPVVQPDFLSLLCTS